MPYTAATVPDNVPKKYAAQFAEVWNSSYKAAKADKKSDADAEASAFAQAHGVINKSKAKDARDVSADGPGFGPTEKKNEDGGQVSDPQMTMRAYSLSELWAEACKRWPESMKRYSEDQPRDPDGKFGSGSGEKTLGQLKDEYDHIADINAGLKPGTKDEAKERELAKKINEVQGKKYDETFKLHHETYGKSKEESKQIALKESGLRS